MTPKVETIATVCQALSTEGPARAEMLLRRDYPFAPNLMTSRRYGPEESMRVFRRDGFIDRYSGHRLVFPPVLRLLSFVMPREFPYQPNWKTTVTHPAYWEIGATVDHLEPVSLGGLDEESNWMTTSMARNSAKMNWRLDELGWKLHPPGDYADWDGLVGWFMKYSEAHPEFLKVSSVRRWHRAAKLTAFPRGQATLGMDGQE